MKEILLASAAGLFILFLIARLIRGVILGRQLAGSSAPGNGLVPEDAGQSP